MKLKHNHCKMIAVAIVMFCRSVFRCQLLQAVVGLGVVVLLAGLSSQAKTNTADLDRKVQNLRNARLIHIPASEFIEPPVRASQNGLLDTGLRVFFADNIIGGHPVHLRSYEGLLTGPTLRIRPGDILRILLENDLPPEDGAMHHEDVNEPHGFNTTNLHTHGLHVDPKDPSDNVLRQIPPGDQWQYQYDIRMDHPAGTFWYHAHKHGSAAVQLASGMAGALIVEGGIDEIPEIRAAKERLFVLQQIPYDEAGTVEYKDVAPSFLNDFVRHTTVNGQLKPTVQMRPGEVQRWRIVNAGIHEQVEVVLVDLTNPDAPPQDLHVIALDGLALGRIDTVPMVEMGPGYRVDILVQLNEPGTYQFAKIEEAAGEGLHRIREQAQILAEVVVEGEPLPMDLPSDASLRPYVPHKPISDAELTGRQRVDFEIAEVEGQNEPHFLINGNRFDPERVRVLRLGDVEEWTLTSDSPDYPPEWGLPATFSTHPFHIHVNPFQVMSIGGVPLDKPEFRDTIFVRKGEDVVIRSRYEVFTGKFVLHCHILQHEDLGMMEVVEIRPPEDFSQVFFMSLSEGLNMVSLPLKTKTPHTARSFADEISATVVIEFDERRQRFVGFTLGAPDDGFPIKGGKGYIVSVPERSQVAFVGTAWSNRPPVEADRAGRTDHTDHRAEAAPPVDAELTDGAWAFVVSGRTARETTDGYLVTVRNTRTNAVATDVVRNGYFAAALADLSRQSIVEVGDQLELTLIDTAGEIASEPVQLTVTQEAISQAFVPMKLTNIGAPRQSALQQNYPNPFNPETWLPYQLKESAQITIQIYDEQGGLVRTLDLGQRDAGFYASRARAAYWDGKNDVGEPVASGVYFYQLRAGDFSATRRMAVVK